MKKGLKFGCLGIIILIVLIIAISSCGNGDDNNNTGDKTTDTPKQTAPAKPGRAEYEKIKVGDAISGKGGMTIEEVEKILGKHDNQTESESGGMKMVVYTFNAKGSLGAHIGVTTINGLVTNKSQYGLEE